MNHIEALEDMIARRMKNTGETRAQACAAVSDFLTRFAARDQSKDVHRPDGSLSFEISRRAGRE
jgi:hypothetical protein